MLSVTFLLIPGAFEQSDAAREADAAAEQDLLKGRLDDWVAAFVARLIWFGACTDANELAALGLTMYASATTCSIPTPSLASCGGAGRRLRGLPHRAETPAARRFARDPHMATVQRFRLDLPLREARSAFERRYLELHLERQAGSVTRLSEVSGLERTNLYRKLKQLGIEIARSESLELRAFEREAFTEG